MFGVGQGLHDLTYRRDVPELGVDARLGGRLGEDFLEFLFLVGCEFRRVLVPRMAGEDRAHPGGLPVGRPFLHGPLGPLNHLRDDADSDSFRGVQNRFGLHPHQHMIVGTLLPPDQDGGLLPGRPRPARPDRIRNSTGNPRKIRFRFMSAINLLSHVDRATGESVRRYEHDHPGVMLHVDVKKLGELECLVFFGRWVK